MHKHHIIPRHMGGSDDPSNLIELTIEQHANAHKKLYEEHGRKQDLCAWKSLAKQIGKEEIWLMTSSIGGSNNIGIKKTEEHKKKISEAIKGTMALPEEREKISNAMKGNSNSKNHKSDEYKRIQSLAMKEAWARRKIKGE